MAEPTYLPVVAAATALASVPLLHWILLRRGVAVSGRFTALVDRLRHGRTEATPESQASQEELAAALRAMTAEAFGAEAIESDGPVADEHSPPPAPRPAADPPAVHGLFLVGLIAGGVVGALIGNGFSPSLSMDGDVFATLFGGSLLTRGAALFGGGLLVGVGTRMAGGCTSGHGLCGVSQMQPGSLVATAAFFGAGVATSFLLGAFA